MNFLFLMDPLETVVYEKDTTFMFMLESHKRGYKTFYLPKGGIVLKKGCLFFNVTEVVPQENPDQPFVIKNQLTLGENEVQAIFIRPDPPFDEEYLMNTWLLDIVADRIAVINKPSGIRTVNEKIWAMQFTSIIPKTLLTRHLIDVENFFEESGKLVLKPTNGYGGKGVSIISQADQLKIAFNNLSQNGSTEVIVQEYVKESEIGDKRILLLNGNPLGAVLRVHSEGQQINNFMAGGSAHKTDITQNDQMIINCLKPQLKDLGLYFVGIDIMGDKLIEVNVTSPTCLQEINKLENLELEKHVIDFTENLIDQLQVHNRI